MSAVEKLRLHFQQLPPRDQANGWEALWEQKLTPWDRNTPNPALVDVLQEKQQLLIPSTATDRKRALVPGCGKGYDVLLLASHGYDAWGLDAAPSAVRAAEEVREQSKSEPGQYPVQNEDSGAGKATFLLANFFDDDFLAKTGGNKFDVIYDYTFLCALHPDMRPAWAKRMSELLSDTGSLVCLEFPLGKPPSSGGPPHGLTSELYVELFKQPGEQVTYDQSGIVVPNSEQQISLTGLHRVMHETPQRTHAVGRESDRVSIYQHVKHKQ